MLGNDIAIHIVDWFILDTGFMNICLLWYSDEITTVKYIFLMLFSLSLLSYIRQIELFFL